MFTIKRRVRTNARAVAHRVEGKADAVNREHTERRVSPKSTSTDTGKGAKRKSSMSTVIEDFVKDTKGR